MIIMIMLMLLKIYHIYFCFQGDEESDDKMIEVLYEIIAHAPPHSDIRRCKTFSVNVGKRYV